LELLGQGARSISKPDSELALGVVDLEPAVAVVAVNILGLRSISEIGLDGMLQAVERHCFEVSCCGSFGERPAAVVSWMSMLLMTSPQTTHRSASRRVGIEWTEIGWQDEVPGLAGSRSEVLGGQRPVFFVAMVTAKLCALQLVNLEHVALLLVNFGHAARYCALAQWANPWR
jgi:hypothetical protein